MNWEAVIEALEDTRDGAAVVARAYAGENHGVRAEIVRDIASMLANALRAGMVDKETP